MDVLVTHASRSGATDAIARRVADRLRTRGLQVQLVPVGEVEDVEAYDAVVVGGGTSGRHWLRPARRFVQRHEEELARRPVWLFGRVTPPIGAQGGGGRAGVGPARPREFDEFHQIVEAEDEAVFVRGEVGVDAWADEIADRLDRLRRDRAIDAVHEMREVAGDESSRA